MSMDAMVSSKRKVLMRVEAEAEAKVEAEAEAKVEAEAEALPKTAMARSIPM